jgi:hypothetical protein
MSIGEYFRATETETRAGRCETHGTVEATREIPRFRWPHAGFWIFEDTVSICVVVQNRRLSGIS